MKNIDKKQIVIISIAFLLLVCTGVGFYIAYTNKEEYVNNDKVINRRITEGGSFEITGESDSLVIDTEENVVITLNNASIKSEGPAINIINAKSVTIKLIGENFIESSVNEEEDGAIYSSDDLIFEGEGSLTINSNLDGIVSKDNIVIKSGTYIINSGDDAIRGKDYVNIIDGVFNIDALGDAIKSNNDEEEDLGYIVIDGGEFNIKCSKDGMDAISSIVINSGVINIESSDDAIHSDGLLNIKNGTLNLTAHEGLEATYAKIDGGNITINASDDGINAGNKSSKYSVLVEINGGDIAINMGQGDTDGVDSNGDIVINGGTIRVNGQSTFDYDGSAKLNGGVVIINGVETTSLPNQMMGGGMMGGDPRQGRR